MTLYVVDPSVAVEWLVSEPLSDRAALLRNPGISLLAPALLFAEAANALWAMRQRRDLADEDFVSAVQTLTAAPIFVPRSLLQLTPMASRVAADLAHPVYDCFYLALALQERVRLVTADLKFCARVERHPYLSGSIVRLADLS